MNTRVPPHAGSPPGWYPASPDDARPRWWNGRDWTDTYLDSLESLWMQPDASHKAAETAEQFPADPSSAPSEAASTESDADAAEHAERNPDPARRAEPDTDQPDHAEPPADRPEDAEPDVDHLDHAEPPAEDQGRSSIYRGAAAASAYDAHHPVRDPILDLRRIPRGEDRIAPRVSAHTLSSSSGSNVNRAQSAASWVTVSSKNGPAKASLFVALMGLIVACLVPWWYAAGSRVIAQALFVGTIALFCVAFVLAIVGIVLALRRPTTKTMPVAALLLSSVLVVGAVVLYALTVAAAPSFDGADVESTVEAWYLRDRESFAAVICPRDVPTSDGSVFVCSAHLESGQVETVQVQVQDGSFTWRTVTP